jgi:hypothetical protein
MRRVARGHGPAARKVRAILCGLVFALAAGCAGPAPASAAGDWRYSDVLLAIDAFRTSDRETAAKLPKTVRSIYVTGPDTLSVYLADLPDGRRSGIAGCELKLKRYPSGTWVVVGTRFFEI